MNATIHPSLLAGTVEIPSSKSYAHRMLICAALSDAQTIVSVNASSEDIRATVNCLTALGATIETIDTGYRVTPIDVTHASPCILDCHESGSTLRFMLPIAAALGQTCTFIGTGRLPERPNAILTDALNAHGVQIDRDRLPIHLCGKLLAGEYSIAGNISSQYITGLLLALPLCEQDSELIFTTPLESATYVDITLNVLHQFGIRIIPTATGYHIPGGQCYHSPGALTAEGDWSSATFWQVANALGSAVDCLGLNTESIQGDRAIDVLLKQLGGTIDVCGTPDLVPALSVAAAVYPGTTHITGAARLRLKESDRLSAVSQMLTALGANCEELPDGLIIHGGHPFIGGCVDGFNDHRIVMATAIAATIATEPVTISDMEAVNKSYPSFFEEFQRLGGIVDVKSDR